MQLVTRKIRKGQWGLQAPSLSNSFANAVQPNLNLQARLGDMTALSLVTNYNLGEGLQVPTYTHNYNTSSSSSINPVEDSKGGISSGLQAGLGIAGQLLGSFSDAIPSLDKVHNANDQLSSDIRSTANKALLSGAAGPWGMLAGALNLGIDKTGGFTDASKGLGGTNDTLNTIASLALPGAGWFTKKTIDYDVSGTLKRSGDSYSGTLDKANTAAQNAGAKILFGRNKANSMIANAILSDTKVQNIVAENELAQAGANNPLIGLRNQFNMQGGWQYGTIKYGRKGMSLQMTERVKNIISTPKHKEGGPIVEQAPTPTEIFLVDPNEIPEFREGGYIPQKLETSDDITFDSWYNMIPEDKRDTTNYNLRRAFELAPKEELLEFVNNPDSHLRTFYYNQDGIGEFMKSKNHPTLWMELEYYNNGNQVINKDGKDIIIPADKKEWEQFKKNYNLDTSGEYYKYIPKNLERFEKGGSINVIPDGALHARKHNMDMKGITKKGIPVVSDTEDGQVEQQAEIEREEIIFRLEVTKKLEELQKKYYDSETSKKEKDKLALEAGKLLVQEILYNTMDNVNLIDKV